MSLKEGDKVRVFGYIGIWVIETIYSADEVEVSSGASVTTVSLEELTEVDY